MLFYRNNFLCCYVCSTSWIQNSMSCWGTLLCYLFCLYRSMVASQRLHTKCISIIKASCVASLLWDLPLPAKSTNQALFNQPCTFSFDFPVDLKGLSSYVLFNLVDCCSDIRVSVICTLFSHPMECWRKGSQIF